MVDPNSTVTIGWVAGWLEGEGSFHYSETAPTATRKAYGRIKIVGASNDLETLERVQKHIGGKINGPYKYDDKRQPHYQWGIRDKASAVHTMRILFPYMGTRRKEQIIYALEKAGIYGGV